MTHKVYSKDLAYKKERTQGKNVIVVLDRKYNNGLVKALFFGADPSGHFLSRYYCLKEKDERWFALANSYKFQKCTNGIFNRLLMYDKDFVKEITELSSRFERVYIFANNAIFHGPVWYEAEFKKSKRRALMYI